MCTYSIANQLFVYIGLFTILTNVWSTIVSHPGQGFSLATRDAKI